MDVRAMNEWLIDRVRADRARLVDTLRVLWAFEQERGPLLAGCSSLHVYCTDVLRLAKSSATKLVKAAELMAKHEAIAGMLESGALNLSVVYAIRKLFAVKPAEEVLAAAAGMTRDEAEAYVKEVLPEELRRETIEPIDGERYRLTAVITEADGMLLDEAQNILSHVVPDASPGAVIGRVLKVALPKLRSMRYRSLLRPEVPRGTSEVNVDGDHIPASVARAVWERDGFACTYRGADGRRCWSQWQCQPHHRLARAKGGLSTVENLTIHCAAHNRLEAENDFGREYMDTFRRRP